MNSGLDVQLFGPIAGDPLPRRGGGGASTSPRSRGLWTDAKAMPPWEWWAREHERKAMAVPFGR